jgi:hypothetical protein
MRWEVVPTIEERGAKALMDRVVNVRKDRRTPIDLVIVHLVPTEVF